MFSCGSASADDSSLMAELLSLAGIDRRYPRLELAPQQRKQKTLDALWRLVEVQGRRRPILAVFEDGDWIDPASLRVLERAIEKELRLPILILKPFRPEFDAPWAGKPQAQALAFTRLGLAA